MSASDYPRFITGPSQPLRPRSLILMPNWIGDLLTALAVVEDKSAQTDEQIELLVPEGMTDLVRLLSPLPVISYRRRSRVAMRATLAEVRARAFDRIYLLPFSFSSGWFAFKSRIPTRRGICREGRWLLLTERLPRTTRDLGVHITQEYASVLNIPPRNPETLRGQRIAVNRVHAGTIVFCPGAVYGPAKRWLGFAELATTLSAERIVVLGSEAETDASVSIARAAPSRVTDLAGKTSLIEAARIVAGARLVVSNDSGLMHLAAYLGVPTVAIFGSTSPVWTRPIGDRAKVVQSDVECSPCFDRTCRYGHYRCLREISVHRVTEACRVMLDARVEGQNQNEELTHGGEKR
ncbi:MAG: lipopolysaccharide heptosyltransferase II [Chitinivibrionales bacterium]|nr:lipopolysaccharide heptosyltransferase II [Chitinivibrionales bacterium]MBD3356773.1 lipopolysaccharide heptosyltransferase II [Chitinivibrionales bacterium]